MRNSWGTGWGSEGYAWVKPQDLKENLIECYAVSER